VTAQRRDRLVSGFRSRPTTSLALADERWKCAGFQYPAIQVGAAKSREEQMSTGNPSTPEAQTGAAVSALDSEPWGRAGATGPLSHELPLVKNPPPWLQNQTALAAAAEVGVTVSFPRNLGP
jgi:hypothetical protein